MTEPEARVRRRVIVRGRVQGVWFRGSTEAEARRAGVCGWVRNRPDGAVEAAFEGSRDAVEALVRYVHEGPSHAHVESVEVVEEPPMGDPAFHVAD